MRLAVELLSFSETIPDYSTRYPNVLESCLAAPFQTFGGKALYPSFSDRAAILFYLMIKDHPFQNGNKRIAMTSLFVLLHKNKRWLKVDAQELYNFTVWVAQSPARLKDETVKAVAKFLKIHMEKIRLDGPCEAIVSGSECCKMKVKAVMLGVFPVTGRDESRSRRGNRRGARPRCRVSGGTPSGGP
jgi:death-on-curing protein